MEKQKGPFAVFLAYEITSFEEAKQKEKSINNNLTDFVLSGARKMVFRASCTLAECKVQPAPTFLNRYSVNHVMKKYLYGHGCRVLRFPDWKGLP
jgi:hypothetical protein